jgi:thiamine transport system substrate-binding protein
MRARNSIALFAVAGILLTGCSSSQPTGSPNPNDPPKSVTLIVHDSFPAKEFEVAASAATGFDVKVVVAGDGELSTQLVLTKGAPLADAFYGVNDAYAGRLIQHEVVVPFTPTQLPERAKQFADAFGAAPYPMVPVDLGAACLNIDPAWFAARGIPEPTSYQDLLREEYRGLTVLTDPSTSSTGASFLLGTVAALGESGFEDYWRGIAGNGVRLESSWSDAYYGQFTGGGDGTYPIVLSYSSSPAWTLTEDESASTTKALLDTCTSQLEYAGILEGAANPVGAQAVVEYLLSREFQDTIADTMYVYPIDAEAYVPEAWQSFAPLPTSPHDLGPLQIADGMESWLRKWSDATGW